MSKRIFCSTIAAALAVGALAAVAAVAANGGPRACQVDCATAVVPPIAASPFGITSGPLGSIWFSLDNSIARIDRQGRISTYPLPDPNELDAGWMTTGPSGSVWFAERDTGKIGRITASGRLTEFALPTSTAVPRESCSHGTATST